MLQEEQEFVRYWTPRKPLCSNDINRYSYRQTRDRALTHKWIETSALAARNLIVADVDKVFAHAHLQDLVSAGELPAPTFTIISTESTHAHVAWRTVGAVAMQRKPVRPEDPSAMPGWYPGLLGWEPDNAAQRFYKNVERRLWVAAGADLGYTRRTMRNPLVSGSEHGQVTVWGSSDAYSLQSLVDALPAPEQRRDTVSLLDLPLFNRPLELTGGRNTDTFNALRFFAYRAFHRCEDTAEFHAAVRERANDINRSWDVPLDGKELDRIIGNVSDWVLRNFRRSDLPEIQRARANRRWLGSDRAKELHQERIDREVNPDRRAALVERLESAEAREAFDNEVLAYIEAGEKLRSMYEVLGEPRGMTYDAFAKKVQRLRKRDAIAA